MKAVKCKWEFFIKMKRRVLQTVHYSKFLLAKVCVLLSGNREKDVWLIAERGFDARDNAYVFYCYLKKHHPEITCKYVITKDSFDLGRIAPEDIIWHKSFQNYIYFITAKALISTHTYGYSPEMRLFENIEKYGLVRVKGVKVYLSHGLAEIQKYSWGRRDLDLYTCGSKTSWEYLVSASHFGKDVVRLTGTPRMDNLYAHKNDPKEKIILVMPTWRQYVRNMTEGEFLNDIYYRTFQTFLDDGRVIRWLEQIDYRMIFYPHIEMQKFIQCFHSRSERVIIGDATKYVVEDLLLKSKVMITDYSSVFFDFALLSKKVIYFHFEKLKLTLRSGFTWEENAFGPIFYDQESLITYLTAQESLELDEIYRKRVHECFPVFDGNNSKRVYKSIKEIVDRKFTK